MGKSFQEILDSYLIEKSQNPNKKAEEIIETVNNRVGVAPSKLDVIKEQCKELDELSAEYSDLQQSIKDGLTKEEWIAESLEDAVSGLSEDQMNKVQNAILKGLDQFAQSKVEASLVEEVKMENLNTQSTKKDVTVTK